MKEIEDVPYIGIKLQNSDEVKRSGGDSISMKSYLGLTAAYEKVHRKTGRITTVLLGLLGESENSLMRSLYLLAFLLVLLVLAAGTVMISQSAPNSSLRDNLRDGCC